MDNKIAAELLDQIEKLESRYHQLAEFLAETVRDMNSVGRPPSAEIQHDLEHSRAKFADIRDKVYHEAQVEALESLPELNHLLTLVDVRELLLRVEDSRTRMLKRKEMCRLSAQVLDRVKALTHREQLPFEPLAEAQAKAAILRGEAVALAESILPDPEASWVGELEAIVAGHHPFCRLLVQVDGHNTLDDEAWQDLMASLTREFGKPLALAATRGRLVSNENEWSPDEDCGVSDADLAELGPSDSAVDPSDESIKPERNATPELAATAGSARTLAPR